jgi:lipoprotein signal peptidase
MSGTIAFLILVPLLDQTLKFLVIRRLGHRRISLGRLGEVRYVQRPIWIARAWPAVKPATIWIVWITGAVVIAFLCSLIPSTGFFSGLILGGTFSHALEISLCGSVCDYVALRFWPAFNFADVAITAGAIGLLAKIVTVSVG